jgi:hypothetical protein
MKINTLFGLVKKLLIKIPEESIVLNKLYLKIEFVFLFSPICFYINEVMPGET